MNPQLRNAAWLDQECLADLREKKKERSTKMKLRVVLYCLLGGLPLSIAALGAGHFAWWWLSGILFAGSFVPIALFGPRTALGQFAAIAPELMIVTVLCLWSEGLIFLPQNGQNVVRDLLSRDRKSTRLNSSHTVIS